MAEQEIKCFDVPEYIDQKKYPYLTKYIRLYGVGECMSKWDLKKPYKSTEEVYKACIEKGVSWKNLLKFNGYERNVLL